MAIAPEWADDPYSPAERQARDRAHNILEGLRISRQINSSDASYYRQAEMAQRQNHRDYCDRVLGRSSSNSGDDEYPSDGRPFSW